MSPGTAVNRDLPRPTDPTAFRIGHLDPEHLYIRNLRSRAVLVEVAVHAGQRGYTTEQWQLLVLEELTHQQGWQAGFASRYPAGLVSAIRISGR